MSAALSPTIFRVIGHAENVRKGFRQFMEMGGWTDRQTGDGRMDGLFVCWPFETVFQSISGRLPERGRKNRQVVNERKKCPNNPHLHLLQAQ